MSIIHLHLLDKDGISWAQEMVTLQHYLHRPVDSRCSVEGYAVHMEPLGRAGLLLFGRPEATRCYPWYGSIGDVESGRAEVTRWQVLNLARIWLDPRVQAGGEYCRSEFVPGFVDRKGVWHSALASAVIRLALEQVGYEYLLKRPPCFLDEPFELRWLLSYCDPRYHKGTIYKVAGFEHYRTNREGLMTWRIQMPRLTLLQESWVRQAACVNHRSQSYRARRAQIAMELEV